jgi:hypothetical protein
MAQQPGMMNTAPSPIPGGYTNPTGAGAIGLPTATPGAIPQAYGAPVGAIPTTGGPGGFTANTGGAATGTVTNPTMAGLSSGLGNMSPQDLHNLETSLKNDYGAGPGAMLFQILSQGLFNPQVAQQLINAMQPQIERGLQSTTAAFGAEGARFSSSAQIGVGDYESQAVLGENQVLANMYQNDQMAQLSLLNNILPTINKEQDNSQSSGLASDIIGGLEIAGGIGLTALTGGIGAIGGIPLIASGAKTIAGANSSSGSGGGGGNMAMPSAVPLTLPNTGSSSTGSPVPVGNDTSLINDLMNQWLGQSAGATVGGTPNDPNSSIYSLFGMQG